MTEPNFRSAGAHERNADLIYRGVFADSPSAYLVLTPDLVTVNANAAFLTVAQMRHEELVNRYVFDVFPDNPNDPMAKEIKMITESFDRARRQRDSLALRYDVCRKGIWQRCFWLTTSWPIKDDDGAPIAIIHHTIEIPESASHLLDQSGRLLANTTTLADNLQGIIDTLAKGK